MLGEQRGRTSSPESLAGVREEVFRPSSLALVLGVQYVAGGALAFGWVMLIPQASAHGSRLVVLALAVLAVILGVGMGVLSRLVISDSAVIKICHACILSAQGVVALAYAATQDPTSPLPLFMLWTTPYAGIFSRRARWSHVLTTAGLLVAAMATMPTDTTPYAVAQCVFVLATVLVTTLLVSRMTARLHYAATHDFLTGLPNRRLFLAATTAALARRTAAGGTVLVLLVDLDRFKNVNDSYGHAVGDELLKLVTPRLSSTMRRGDLVARLGGDEFALLCEDPTGRLDPERLVARLVAAFTQPVQVGEHRLYVSGSTGVAFATDDVTPDTLLREADTAMYEAKAAGGSCWRIFDPGATGRSLRLVAVEHGLREAITGSELALHYQPVMHLATGRALGVEALLRWNSPQLGHVGPDEFILVAERSGLIDQLGRWVLDQAVRDLASWRAQGLVDAAFRVAVNVSAYQLTADLPPYVAALLRQHQIPVTSFGVEITESAMMTGETPLNVLRALHELGVSLYLDDFGTGYSSLSHLRRFPLDVIKIDRSFVSGLDRHGTDRSLVLGVLSLSQALGKTVVAEGIETQNQLDVLRDAGCHAGQGYGLSRPVPAPRLPAALAAARSAVLDRAVPAPEALDSRTPETATPTKAGTRTGLSGNAVPGPRR